MLTSRKRSAAGLFLSAVAVFACTDQPTMVRTPTQIGHHGVTPHFNHNAAANAEKGYIDGWLDGEDVSLHYTKWFFCEEPPVSGAASGCVIGADAEVVPRPGPIPTIYAIAAIGIQPDPATLACRAGSPCLNHPAMLDASRVAGLGATNVPGIPHSHIITERRGGWWHTVNIRVFNLDVWNEIAAARSLTKVRELQADPAIGGAGLISQDTPTNIFFFIQVQPDKPGR
jgi:hypothetical protein